MRKKLVLSRRPPKNIYINIVLNGIKVCTQDSVCRLFTKVDKTLVCSIDKRILYGLSFACGAFSMFVSVCIFRFILNGSPILPIAGLLLLSAIVLIVSCILFKAMLLIMCARFITKSKAILTYGGIDSCVYDERTEDKRVFYMVYLGAAFLINLWVLIF